MIGQTTDIFTDGHFIVIENHDHRFAACGCIIHALIGHAAGAGTVTNQRNDIVILLLQCSCPGHAQRNGNRAGCMTGNKSICITFRRLRKSGHTAVLPQMRKIRPATCQQLMDIRLMTDVKYQTVFHCIKNGFDCYSQFHRTQITGQMSAGFGNTVNQEFANLLTQLCTFFLSKLQQVFVTVDFF